MSKNCRLRREICARCGSSRESVAQILEPEMVRYPIPQLPITGLWVRDNFRLTRKQS